MSELAIKVTIAGRTYPLTIKRDEEELVRSAAKLINDNITHLEQNYAVRDKQDLLAMTALQYTNKYLDGKEHQAVDGPELQDLKDLSDRLDQYLEQI